MKFSTKLFPIILLISSPAAKLFAMDLTDTTILESSIEKAEKQLERQKRKVARLKGELETLDSTRTYWKPIADDYAATLNKQAATLKEIEMNNKTAKKLVKNVARLKCAVNETIKSFEQKKLISQAEQLKKIEEALYNNTVINAANSLSAIATYKSLQEKKSSKGRWYLLGY